MGRLRQITAQRFFGRLVIREYRNDERKEFGLIFFFFIFIPDPSCRGEEGFLSLFILDQKCDAIGI